MSSICIARGAKLSLHHMNRCVHLAELLVCLCINVNQIHGHLLYRPIKETVVVVFCFEIKQMELHMVHDNYRCTHCMDAGIL